MIKVYDYYQLGSFKGKFSDDISKAELVKKACKISDDNEHLVRINETWQTSGKMYVEDKEATKKFHEEIALQDEIEVEAKEIKKVNTKLKQN